MHETSQTSELWSVLIRAERGTTIQPHVWSRSSRRFDLRTLLSVSDQRNHFSSGPGSSEVNRKLMSSLAAEWSSTSPGSCWLPPLCCFCLFNSFLGESLKEVKFSESLKQDLFCLSSCWYRSQPPEGSISYQSLLHCFTEFIYISALLKIHFKHLSWFGATRILRYRPVFSSPGAGGLLSCKFCFLLRPSWFRWTVH